MELLCTLLYSLRYLGQRTLLFALFTSLITFLMILMGVQIYGETVGLIALLTEVAKISLRVY